MNLNRQVDGPFDLLITSGGSTVARPPALGGIGTVTALDTVTTDAGGSTRLQDDASVITTGAQTYNDFIRVGDSANSVGNATLTGSGINLSASATFRVDIDGDAGIGVVGGHDQLAVNGTLNLGGAALSIDFGSFAPVAGNSYVILENDGIDAITGTFAGFAEGAVSSGVFGSTAMFYDISYQGGDGNDVEITLLGEPETLVTLSGLGHLLISDINGGASDDDLTIEIDGTNLAISDSSQSVSSTIVGATQDGLNRILIPLALITGNISITTLGGDDTITIGELGTLGGDLIVNGGADEDRIVQTGEATLAGTNFVTYTAEAIKLETGASLTTVSGDITLTAVGVTSTVGNQPGVWLQSASLTSTSGDITLTGEGGDFDHYNDGVRINVDKVALTPSAISTGGDITILGTAGSGISSAGVHINASSVSTTGTGELTINGTGSNGGNFGVGVYLFDTTLATAGGDADINGTGGSQKSSNYGVVLYSGSTIAVGGSGDLAIRGTGGGSIGLSPGIAFVNGSSASVVNGAMTVSGTGGTGTGSQNRGVSLGDLTSLSASGTGTITVLGTGRGGGSDNGGVLIDGASIATVSGLITLTGTGSTTGTNYNEGLDLINTAAVSSSSGNINLTGTANGSGRYNRGINLNKSTIQSTSGHLTLVGVSSATSTLNYNQGIFSQGGTLTAGGKITLTGTGGGGTSNNHGIHLHSTTAAAGGILQVTGRALAGTSGTLNTGVYLTNLSSLTGASGSTVTGTGGGGTGKNHGILMNKDVSVTGLVTGNFVGTVGAGTGSLARAGTHPFFN